MTNKKQQNTMDRESSIRKEALKRTHAWWFCENIIDHDGQAGLLHMGFPRLFILMRDYGTAYWSNFQAWKNGIVEITFMENADKEDTTQERLEELLIDAWNFLTLEEEEEERQADGNESDET